jgi:hypothetical protein
MKLCMPYRKTGKFIWLLEDRHWSTVLLYSENRKTRIVNTVLYIIQLLQLVEGILKNSVKKIFF